VTSCGSPLNKILTLKIFGMNLAKNIKADPPETLHTLGVQAEISASKAQNDPKNSFEI
jgi:hypothetical protein